MSLEQILWLEEALGLEQSLKLKQILRLRLECDVVGCNSMCDLNKALRLELPAQAWAWTLTLTSTQSWRQLCLQNSRIDNTQFLESFLQRPPRLPLRGLRSAGCPALLATQGNSGAITYLSTLDLGPRSAAL